MLFMCVTCYRSCVYACAIILQQGGVAKKDWDLVHSYRMQVQESCIATFFFFPSWAPSLWFSANLSRVVSQYIALASPSSAVGDGC